MVLSVALIGFFGLDPSIEFTGGSIIEVSYPEGRPAISEVRETLSDFVDGASAEIRQAGESGMSVRLPFLEESVQGEVVTALAPAGGIASIERISSIGPTIGQELKRKSLWAMGLVILAIIIFIAISFRKVSEPVSSWKYGITAIIALIHDTIIPTAAFAILGQFFGYQVDVLFITALLAILGYSVNDTIIVFDRIRENLRSNQESGLKEDFGEVVGRSLSQTFRRSLNTSITTLLVLLFLLFVGSESTRHFAMVMVIGIIAGTYSSLFLASPLLVLWEKISVKE